MPSKKQPSLFDYQQIAGNLSLDFVNTLGGGRGFETREYLRSYSDLVAWGQLVGILSRSQTHALIERSEKNEEHATEILNRAQSLREAIYRVVTSKSRRSDTPQEDLFLISREAAFSIGRAKIVATKEGFSWEWPDSCPDLDRILWPISRSAADLITSPELGHVRECASERCTWVFLDTSKNHSRRWCDMRDCGNREKARRHRHKSG